VFWTLNALSGPIPTHQLAEGHYQTPPCIARARNHGYTAERGQGRQNALAQRILNPVDTQNGASEPQEVEIE
jgi:hypothetical protein